MKFWWWRLQVSFCGMYWYGISWTEPKCNWWGWSDDVMDREGFDDDMTPEDYFMEAWGRE